MTTELLAVIRKHVAQGWTDESDVDFLQAFRPLVEKWDQKSRAWVQDGEELNYAAQKFTVDVENAHNRLSQISLTQMVEHIVDDASPPLTPDDSIEQRPRSKSQLEKQKRYVKDAVVKAFEFMNTPSEIKDELEAWLPPLPGLSSFKSEDPSLWLARFQEFRSIAEPVSAVDFFELEDKKNEVDLAEASARPKEDNPIMMLDELGLPSVEDDLFGLSPASLGVSPNSIEANAASLNERRPVDAKTVTLMPTNEQAGTHDAINDHLFPTHRISNVDSKRKPVGGVPVFSENIDEQFRERSVSLRSTMTRKSTENLTETTPANLENQTVRSSKVVHCEASSSSSNTGPSTVFDSVSLEKKDSDKTGHPTSRETSSTTVPFASKIISTAPRNSLPSATTISSTVSTNKPATTPTVGSSLSSSSSITSIAEKETHILGEPLFGNTSDQQKHVSSESTLNRPLSRLIFDDDDENDDAFTSKLFSSRLSTQSLVDELFNDTKPVQPQEGVSPVPSAVNREVQKVSVKELVKQVVPIKIGYGTSTQSRVLTTKVTVDNAKQSQELPSKPELLPSLTATRPKQKKRLPTKLFENLSAQMASTPEPTLSQIPSMASSIENISSTERPPLFGSENDFDDFLFKRKL